MEVKATLAPGQNGTKQLLKKYGDQLVCVRYRYDKARQKKLENHLDGLKLSSNASKEWSGTFSDKKRSKRPFSAS